MISRGRGSSNEGGKTGRSASGAYEVAGSVAMRCAMPLPPSLLRRSPVPILEIAPGVAPGKDGVPRYKRNRRQSERIAGARPLPMRALVAKKQFAVGIEDAAEDDSCLA